MPIGHANSTSDVLADNSAVLGGQALQPLPDRLTAGWQGIRLAVVSSAREKRTFFGTSGQPEFGSGKPESVLQGLNK